MLEHYCQVIGHYIKLIDLVANWKNREKNLLSKNLRYAFHKIKFLRSVLKCTSVLFHNANIILDLYFEYFE